MITATKPPAYHADALRRLIAQQGLTLYQVIERCQLHRRTIEAVLRGDSKPHLRTIGRLAAGLGCDAAEFFPPAPEIAPTEEDERIRKLLEQADRVLRGEYGDVLAGVVRLLDGRKC
jgi:transcriptional regulator with XRE-family HTH domain